MMLGKKRTTEGKAFNFGWRKDNKRWKRHVVMMQEIERQKQLKNERGSGPQIML